MAQDIDGRTLGGSPLSHHPGLPSLHVKRWEIYSAAALGGFCFAIGELMRQATTSMPVRLGEYFSVMLAAPSYEPRIVGAVLAVTIVLACCAAWIHEPRTRLDAFSRGLAVFAVLSIAAPPAPQGGPDSGVQLRSSAAQAETTAVQPAPPSRSGLLDGLPRRQASWLDLLATPALAQELPAHTGALAEATFRLEVEPGAPLQEEPLVTIRDAETTQVLARQRVSADGWVTLTAPPGAYDVEVEGPSLQRSRARVFVEDKAEYSIPVERSAIPTGLQYLLPQQEVMPQEMWSED